MKKLLCVLLSLVLLLFFAACGSAEKEQEEPSKDSKENGYQEALEILFAVANKTATKEQVKNYFPPEYWENSDMTWEEYFEKLKNDSDDQTSDVSSYKITKVTEWDQETMDAYKEDLQQYYYVAEDAVEEGCTLSVTTTDSEGNEETGEISMAKINGKWYNLVALEYFKALAEMFAPV